MRLTTVKNPIHTHNHRNVNQTTTKMGKTTTKTAVMFTQNYCSTSAKHSVFTNVVNSIEIGTVTNGGTG